MNSHKGKNERAPEKKRARKESKRARARSEQEAYVVTLLCFHEHNGLFNVLFT